MDVAGDVEHCQAPKQLGRQVEVRLVDEIALGLERVAAVAHTIEDRAWLQTIEQFIAVGIHQKVDDDGVAFGHAFEAPRRGVKDGAVDILPVGKQRAQQVRPEEAAGAKHQDGALQAADLLWQARGCHGVLVSSLTMEAGSRPDSCRW